jgi:hypothetical protein
VSIIQPNTTMPVRTVTPTRMFRRYGGMVSFP